MMMFVVMAPFMIAVSMGMLIGHHVVMAGPFMPVMATVIITVGITDGDVADIKADQLVTIREGEGIVKGRPFK